MRGFWGACVTDCPLGSTRLGAKTCTYGTNDLSQSHSDGMTGVKRVDVLADFSHQAMRRADEAAFA